MSVKMGVSFHRTFPLLRDTLRQIIEAASARGSLTYNSIREDTTLGTIQVQSARRYAIGVGLLDEAEKITRFGRLVGEKDAGLSRYSTQWLMHYHLMAPHRNGPLFWPHIFMKFISSGGSISSQMISEELGMLVRETEGREIEPDTLRKTGTVFLGTYSKLESLGMLGLLKQEGEEYVTGEPAPLETAVFAYALADFWRGVWHDYNSVNLSRITAEDGPAALFLLGSGETNQILREMQERGLLRLERTVRPYIAYRLWERPEDLLEAVYA